MRKLPPTVHPRSRLVAANQVVLDDAENTENHEKLTIPKVHPLDDDVKILRPEVDASKRQVLFKHQRFAEKDHLLNILV